MSNTFIDIPEVDFIHFSDINEAEPLAKNDICKLLTDFKKMEIRGEMLPEPLLKEDKTRFVLFPIKHADVSKQKQLTMTTSDLFDRYGICTKRQRHRFGRRRSSI